MHKSFLAIALASSVSLGANFAYKSKQYHTEFNDDRLAQDGIVYATLENSTIPDGMMVPLKVRLTTEGLVQGLEILDKVADGTPVEGMEALAPVLVDRLTLLVEELPAGTHVVLCDPERVRTRAHDLVRTSEEFLQASWAAAKATSTSAVLATTRNAITATHTIRKPMRSPAGTTGHS